MKTLIKVDVLNRSVSVTWITPVKWSVLSVYCYRVLHGTATSVLRWIALNKYINNKLKQVKTKTRPLKEKGGKALDK